MARKPQSARSRGETPRDGKSNRDKIVDAFVASLAERPFEEIGFGDIAARSRVPLTECRAEFASTMRVLAAHIEAVDRQVLAGGDADMANEPPRERLFDVLMRRLELLAPHRAAVRSLMRSACRNPTLALALNGLAVRSQQWMLTAADIDSAGPRGLMRAQGLALLFADVLRTFVRDEEEGLARTMAALDRALARGQTWSNLLDDLCRFVPPACFPGTRRRARREETDDEAAAA
jgi:AcrR family transcriptional regulator